ncbi:MAG TPA: Rv3654c family TadE-like protein [Marmoricola sp.]|nr:Rv3654c family TadE-like protein [Marmoricola sp.]
MRPYACRPGTADRDERGAGTVLGLTMAAVVLFVALAVAGATAVVTTHRVAQSAADLAALAGATALQQGDDACGQAGEVARANRATLRSCAVDGWTVTVSVTASGATVLGRRVEQAARGRAGPVLRTSP